MARERLRKDVQRQGRACGRGARARCPVRQRAPARRRGSRFRHKLRAGELNEREIEIEVADSGAPMQFEVPGQPGASVGMINLGDMLGKAFGGRTKKRKMTVAESHETLMREESDKLLDQEKVVREARESVEQNGIVFIDEIDKITARSEFRGGGDVSREGVQRDLLPLIEGTTVNTKHGPVKTDHVLFICSGAFHLAKPSDMLPELQGRLPIRVSLASLSQEDFRRILTEPEASLVKQYKALLATEKVELEFKPDAIDELAKLSADINETVENIGARRLHTVMEKLLEEISFTASDKPGEKIDIDAAYVREARRRRSRRTPTSAGSSCSRAGPTLADQLGPVLEVHGVVVIPLAAPDEALGLEDLGDLVGDAVAIGDVAAIARPGPVVGLRHVDVDGGREGMHAGEPGVGDDPAVERAGRRHEIGLQPVGQAFQPRDDAFKAGSDVVDRRQRQVLRLRPRHPDDGPVPSRRPAAPAVAVHLEEEGRVTESSRAVVARWRTGWPAGGIGLSQLVREARIAQHRIE